ncbi:unnamed protein product [Medioppia subpectinata]|uniref:L-rhamnose mutarotase n=1 Tax=Medioppia subpectinata TaxID=1979941 RepID=A0A7R9KHU0_9ACAR|nr:unnamed protein product [Medioppia subpectinata]CAG2103932.1 unnamed protein product [Medioppia subpectinata]
MKRYCLALDLKDDPKLIEEYEKYHQNVWPEIKKSITDSGIVDMQIYRLKDRMFMIMETEDDFSFEKKAQMDANNAKVQQWEQLMWTFQKSLPFAKPGEKWIIMDRVFKL